MTMARTNELKAIALAATLSLFIAGCGARNEKDSSAVKSGTPQSSAPAPEQTPASAGDAPAPAAPVGGSETPGGPAAAPASTPASPAPAPSAATSPAPKASGGQKTAPSSNAKPAAGSASAPARTERRPGSNAEPDVVPPAPRQPGPAPAPAPAAPKSEIVLGSYGQESGPLGALASPVIGAAKAWVADVNARGGLNGHRVRIIFADDGGDPSRALGIVRNFVETEKILAIFAEHGPVTVSTVVPYLEKAGVPRIGSIEGNKIVDESPVSFQVTGAKFGNPWSHILPLIADPSIKKLHTVYCREIEHCKFINDVIVKDFAPQLGLTVVGQSQSSLAQPDFTPEVVAAKAEGAQAIVSIMDNATTVRIARAVKRQGGDLVVTSQTSTNAESFYKNGGADVEGVMLASPTAEYSQSPKMADYRNAMARYQPGVEKSGFGSTAWAHGKLLEAAARNLSANPTPTELMDALYALRNETLGGIVPPLTFPRGRSHENVNLCVVIGKVKDGRFVPKDNDPDKFTCAPGWKPETPT